MVKQCVFNNRGSTRNNYVFWQGSNSDNTALKDYIPGLTLMHLKSLSTLTSKTIIYIAGSLSGDSGSDTNTPKDHSH